MANDPIASAQQGLTQFNTQVAQNQTHDQTTALRDEHKKATDQAQGAKQAKAAVGPDGKPLSADVGPAAAGAISAAGAGAATAPQGGAPVLPGVAVASGAQNKLAQPAVGSSAGGGEPTYSATAIMNLLSEFSSKRRQQAGLMKAFNDKADLTAQTEGFKQQEKSIHAEQKDATGSAVAGILGGVGGAGLSFAGGSKSQAQGGAGIGAALSLAGQAVQGSAGSTYDAISKNAGAGADKNQADLAQKSAEIMSSTYRQGSDTLSQAVESAKSVSSDNNELVKQLAQRKFDSEQKINNS